MDLNQKFYQKRPEKKKYKDNPNDSKIPLEEKKEYTEDSKTTKIDLYKAPKK